MLSACMLTMADQVQSVEMTVELYGEPHMDPQILPLRRAAEEIGLELDTLRKSSRKYNALILVGGGLEYVDIARFNNGLEADVKAKMEQIARRANSKSSSGRKIGLLRARIERSPGLIAGKEGAITAAKKQIVEAQNLYEKSKAKKNLTDLEAGLKRLKDGFAKDQAELDRILNEELEA